MQHVGGARRGALRCCWRPPHLIFNRQGGTGRAGRPQEVLFSGWGWPCIMLEQANRCHCLSPPPPPPHPTPTPPVHHSCLPPHLSIGSGLTTSLPPLPLPCPVARPCLTWLCSLCRSISVFTPFPNASCRALCRFSLFSISLGYRSFTWADGGGQGRREGCGVWGRSGGQGRREACGVWGRWGGAGKGVEYGAEAGVRDRGRGVENGAGRDSGRGVEYEADSREGCGVWGRGGGLGRKEGCRVWGRAKVLQLPVSPPAASFIYCHCRCS